MSYSWEQVKLAVEREENRRLDDESAHMEVAEGHAPRGFYVVRRTRPSLTIVGGVVMGLHVAVISLIFNYLAFVWILHVNFDF